MSNINAPSEDLITTEKPGQPAAEIRRFTMHNKLVMDMMRRQAGSLQKAIMECVMNSIDAGATICEVQADCVQVSVRDNGRGIANREEIENNFEVFGQPHDESEKKTYGTFRMGRGQAFSFGRNTWRTGSFTMLVDINKWNLDYRLTAEDSEHLGCDVVIDLYDVLNSAQSYDVSHVLSKWLKYAPIPVFLNGKQISVDPATEEWDTVSDDAYIRLCVGECLSVYNKGIHVTDMGSYVLGTGGTVVSKHQLKVNFARNDIQSDCPVWKRIRPELDKRAQESWNRKTRMNDASRQRLAALILSGVYPQEMEKFPLFTSVSGRQYNLKQLLHFHRSTPLVSFAKEGDLFGDAVMQRKRAFVFSDATLTRFQADMTDLIEVINTMVVHAKSYRHPSTQVWKPQYVPISTMRESIQDTFDELVDQDLTPLERIWLAIAKKAEPHLFVDYEAHRDCRRRLVIGESHVAQAWTDGLSYIALNRSFIRGLRFNLLGFQNLGHTLLHEYVHSEADNCGHVHDHTFYETFHDCAPLLGGFVQRCLLYLPTALREANRKIRRVDLLESDAQEKSRRGVDELREICEDSLRVGRQLLINLL